MNKQGTQKYQHVCPRNCPSACTMISYIENDHVLHITGDTTHPYTGGKLCAKGFSYIEQNYHQERLKYPYYQKVKGSGKFKQISWEKAYELITNELIKIHQHFGSFLPLALYKGFGNIGLHHYVTDKFFSSINETTRIMGASSLLNSSQLFDGMRKRKRTDPATIVYASIIIIWGANPAVSNIHLIPFIIEAKMKGAKIVVIDPLYTQTVELADLFIQLRPKTDKTLAYILIKNIIDANRADKTYIEQHTVGFSAFSKMLKEMNIDDALQHCDIPKEALDLLLTWLKAAKTVSYIVGTGIQKHAECEGNLLAIEALAVVRGDIEKKGGGLFFKFNDIRLFTAPYSHETNKNNRIIYSNELNNYTYLSNQLPIEMLWISCGNPLIQEVNPNIFRKFIEDIPFVVTVDRFMTPTALMSNLVLPTTSHFEETDIVISNWHGKMALNEKAISPFYESRSEWNIVTGLAKKLNEHFSFTCSFPIYSTEEEYLNAQFNDHVFACYSVKNLDEIKEKLDSTTLSKVNALEQQSNLESDDSRFYFTTIVEKNIHSKFQSKGPTTEYPFWLITPHHPYTLNSQFHYLTLSDEKEAFVSIHPKIAEELGIFDGEVVRVFNKQASIEIKVLYSSRVPKDIVMIYQGWYPNSEVVINKLISEWQSVHKEPSAPKHGIAFYDTFVNIRKI